MDYVVHAQALCETKAVGAGTCVGAFAHVRERAVIGRDVEIGDHVYIENNVVIGDRVIIKAGAQLWGGVRVEDDVLIGPLVAFIDDDFPKGERPSESSTPTLVCRGASIGANATVLWGMTIGQNAVVGAGAVVTRPVPPHAIVIGSPARIRGYVDARRRDAAPQSSATSIEEGERRHSRVEGVTLYRLPLRRDLRGSLAVGEFPKEIPFAPRRWFIVFDVPSSEIRGEHAHRTCHLFLVCVRGACSVVADDGEHRDEFRLDRPTLGLHLPPMVWGTQYQHTADAILLVLASDPYDPGDYIRDYQEFLDEARRRRS
jgi:acetyltransferase-like isoleucine patch superfamily enzyme